MGHYAAGVIILTSIMLASLVVTALIVVYAIAAALVSAFRGWRARRPIKPAKAQAIGRSSAATSGVYVPPTDVELLAALADITPEHVTQLADLYLVPGVDFR